MWVILESLRPVKLNKREATIVILEEGPGNKGRNCYYGPESLESGQTIFRGCQVYSDHPSTSEQADLPERSVRDLIGRIKETWIDVSPITGKKQLRGVLKINEGKDFDWAVSLIKESLNAQEEGFPPVAQVSIHADGDIEPNVEIEGHKYNYVKNIKSAVSVDVVTKGGIRNSGFVEFMESNSGGRSMSMDRNTRFRQIQNKLAESLSNEDAAFLEEYLQETNESSELTEAQSSEEPELVEDEAGNVYACTGEVDADGNEVFINEDGEPVVFPGEEIQDEAPEEFAGAEEQEEVEEPSQEPQRRFAQDNGDISIGELAHQFPHLAHEIDQEEMGTMESDRDLDLVAVKMENKLLKSRIIAESKLAESGLAGIVPLRMLVGKSPDEMDVLLESQANMLNAVSNMVQGASAAHADVSLRESSTTQFVGSRILRNSLLPR